MSDSEWQNFEWTPEAWEKLLRGEFVHQYTPPIAQTLAWRLASAGFRNLRYSWQFNEDGSITHTLICDSDSEVQSNTGFLVCALCGQWQGTHHKDCPRFRPEEP